VPKKPVNLLVSRFNFPFRKRVRQEKHPERFDYCNPVTNVQTEDRWREDLNLHEPLSFREYSTIT
jgi:hypothetical protein